MLGGGLAAEEVALHLPVVPHHQPPKVNYTSYTTAICQGLQSFINFICTFFQFRGTYNVV